MSDPDAYIRFIEAGHDDPDRQMAVRVTNFLGGLELRRATAVYALAITQSFRSMGESHQRAAMRALVEACFINWEAWRGQAEGPACEKCGGAATLGSSLEDQQTCPVCRGTGQASKSI
jgi:hypothetical protein